MTSDPVAAAVADLGLKGLLAARAEARRQIQDDGIRFGAMASPTAPGEVPADDPRWHTQGRNWAIDPLPIVIGSAQWARLHAGLEQRARLLDLILTDLYNGRALLHRGLIPPEVVLGHPGFVPQADGLHQAGPHQLVLTGADLGQHADGEWHVLADRSGLPIGAGYAMATRRITTRVMAGLHREVTLARMRGFFHTMTAALQRLDPHGDGPTKAVLLSAGTDSDTAYEHGFLATLLGVPLAIAEDLTMRDGRIVITAGDRHEAVDVIYRRVLAREADPLDLRSSERGIPGLLEATRRRMVGVANPIGAEVLDNPGLLPYLPALARDLLGEDLLLTSAPTWWCGDEAGRRHALAGLDTLIFKRFGHDQPTVTLCGWQLSAARRSELAARIEAAPWAWAAQDALRASETTVVTPTGLESRHFVLRTFGVATPNGYDLLPGGLARVAKDADAFVMPSFEATIAKDVWVLAPDEPARAEATRAPEGDLALPALVRRHTFPPRVAENLFWVGRYCERADGTTRLLRVADDLVEDYAGRPGTTGHATMAALLDALAALTRIERCEPEAPETYVRRVLADAGRRGTIAYAASRLVAAAQEVRDNVPHDLWHVLARLERTIAIETPASEQLQHQLFDVLESTLAVAGIVAESMVRDESWGYIEAGARLERAVATSGLLRQTVGRALPFIIDGQLAESVLDVGASIITHRRRTLSGQGPAIPAQSAIALLLTDEHNPRSVAFSLGRLECALGVVGDAELAAAIGSTLARLRTVDVVELASGDRPAVTDRLNNLTRELYAVSAALSRKHFARAARPRALPTQQTVGAR